MRAFTFSALLCLLHLLLPSVAAAGGRTGCNIIDVTTQSGIPTPIGWAEKFELLLKLDKEFTGGLNSGNNPYEPNDVSIQAAFTSPSGQVEFVYGFYYQDFIIHDDQITAATPADPTTSSLYWEDAGTQYPWRIRFAPNELGTWTYSVSVKHQGATHTYVGALPALTCVPSTNPDNKGFLKVAPNKRNLMFTNGASFFPIGANVDYWGQELKSTGPVPSTGSSSYGCTVGGNVIGGGPIRMFEPDHSIYYRKFSPYMLYGHARVFDDMKTTGANFARLWMHYFSWDFEESDDDLGYYQAHQNRMYDFDRLLASAEANNIYIHLTMLDGARLWDEPDGSNKLWQTFPYNTKLNGTFASTVSSPKPYDHPEKDPSGSLGYKYGHEKGPASFFINLTARRLYKNKIRYIVARWGYSRNICSYELVNEADFADGGLAVGQNYGADLRNKLYPWTKEMATYLRSLDQRHLHTISYGPEQAEEFMNGYTDNGNPVRGYPELVDYTVSHFYSSLTTAEMQKSYLALMQTKRYDKPYQTQEWDYKLAYNPKVYDSKFHSTNWSTAFNGSFGIALPLSAHANLYAPCYPAAAEFRPLAAFLGKYFSSASPNQPIGNSAAAAQVMYSQWQSSNFPTTYLLDPPLAPYVNPLYNDIFSPQRPRPWKDSYGISPGWWSTPNNGSTGARPDVSNNLAYLADGIYLTGGSGDNGLVEVYALKNDARITGWVHNKTHYWYNQKTDSPPTSGAPDYYAPPAAFTMTRLSGETMHIPNLSCQGEYTIQWFYTHVDKDPDGNGPNGPDGGFIPLRHLFPDLGLAASDNTTVGTSGMGTSGTSVIANSNGELVVRVPDLDSLRSLLPAGTPPGTVSFRAPDYAFVITKVSGKTTNNYVTNTSQWRHDIPVVPPSQLQKLGGSYALTADGQDLFYRGGDGKLHQLHYEATGQTWGQQDAFAGITASATANGEAVGVQADGKIMVNAGSSDPTTAGQKPLRIYYQGSQGTVQYYTYDGAWSHGYLIAPSAAADTKLEGDMVWSDPFDPSQTVSHEQVTYRGHDGYLQRYYLAGAAWTHDYLVSGSLSTSWQVKASSRILANTPGPTLFYTGADDRMHHYGSSYGTNWSHHETDVWVSASNTNHYVQGNFAIAKNPSTGDDQVVYRGRDGFVHRLYWVGSPTYKWTHEVVGAASGGTMPSDAAMTPDSRIVFNADGSRIYYRGAYNDMQHFVWYGSYAHNHTDWATGASSSTHNVRQEGDLIATSVNGVEQVFYTGDDGYVQRFYEAASGVKHDWVVAAAAPGSSSSSAVQGIAPLLANADATSLFYAGPDNAVHRYHFSCVASNQRTAATYSPTLPTTKPAAEPAFVCYPNPAHHSLTIAFHTRQQAVAVAAQLYNAMGQQVRELVKSQEVGAGTTTLTVDNLDVAPGIYYVLFFENGVLTNKQSLAIE